MKDFKLINILDIIIVGIVAIVISCVDSFATIHIITILIPVIILSFIYSVKRGLFNDYEYKEKC